MSTFIQLHLLTSYPPSNLNRDELGRPKTAKMGGKDRLRISSQSLKRAWRTSDSFKAAVGDHIGKRTKKMGLDAARKFKNAGILQEDAISWGKQIAEAFAETESIDRSDPYKETLLKQPIHMSHIEYNKLNELIDTLCREKRAPQDEELELLSKEHNAVDIAMFGRMLAVKGKMNLGMDAAVQVAHAITVHEVTVEDDYFTAVDDLNTKQDDAGAAHIGETEFASGVFYLYICINTGLLVENLKNKEPEKANELANKSLAALIEAAATISPTGKQCSFASRACASYILVEKGNQQPRSLSVAFLKPVKGEDILSMAISELEKRRDNFDKVYGPCYGEGSLTKIINFVKE
ncbi:MAG: type I-E CRISPR-associated protein Cas7/Cse4/CasC [Nitrospira bacterium HGW-Nitrospira-1]|nr:MAG: type I-E CRISPR-associated protein Cas7/Cse4/CasC [Nitrospira bacterium HGW-Nitrospira-1]